jgi:hypothetical protein
MPAKKTRTVAIGDRRVKIIKSGARGGKWVRMVVDVIDKVGERDLKCKRAKKFGATFHRDEPTNYEAVIVKTEHPNGTVSHKLISQTGWFAWGKPVK